METETLIPESDSMPAPPSASQPTQANYRPTPDPTRSGALWVGGAGVALLLAAAAVLTAVRWDDIGQSAKLGGMVAITLGLLGIGQRFKDAIPMTGQAIFHLGALLIPFDMAAVAILAGRSWQDTLLLTSVTSVIAWFAIERAVPSVVLRWCAGAAVVGVAAGVAASTPVAMPLALACAAFGAAVGRKTTAAGLWASLAALLPVASFVPWPSRIAGAMTDLGFDSIDQWQPLAAGALSTIALVLVARSLVRLEAAWAAVVAAAVTGVVAFVGFADAEINYISIAALFLVTELLVFVSGRDPLWKQVGSVLGGLAEICAGLATIVLACVAVSSEGFNFEPSGPAIAISGLLFALGWLTADVRRVDDRSSTLAGAIIGSDWAPTTVMFPVAILAAALGFAAPAYAFSLIAIALAFWMVASWRKQAAYGAVLLVMLAAVSASATSMWVELALGAVAAAVLLFSTQLRVRAGDSIAAMLSVLTAMLVWLLSAEAAVLATSDHWALAIVIAGAWAGSWIVEHKRTTRPAHLGDWIGRLTALVVLAFSLWAEAELALGLCALAGVLVAVDYERERRVRSVSETVRSTAFLIIGGVVAGLVAVPIASLAGLAMTTAGAALALAGFVLAGIGMALPQRFDLVLGVAAVVTTLVGLAMALGDDNMFAFALIAAGCTVMFVAAALRDVMVAIAGYAVVALGVALELAALNVDWLEPYLVMPALAAIGVGWKFHRSGGSSWAAYAPTIALFSYVAIADRFAGGSAWHAIIAGTVGVVAIIGGGYRRLVGPLVTGSAVLAIVVGYELLGPAALVPTWAWLAAGGTVLLGAGVALERSDTTPLERGERIRTVIATDFS